MKLPISSIKEYTNLDIPLEEILHIIATKIGEVEGYLSWEEMYKGIYIAEIINKEEHPDAEKLAIYKITLGKKDEIQVVAGDKTLEIGDKVAYIQPGNIVPSTYKTSEEFVIKAVKMRGILSNGMLCSEKELNIGPDHTKVLKLDKGLTVGETFAKEYNLNDTVIEIENKALTNRGDLFGIIGLAREISAAKSKPFTSPEWYKGEGVGVSKESDKYSLEISNQSQALCPRYIGIVLDNVKVSQSPVWLKSILLKSGIRPINSIVDITNYLSILVGQPLHAFDYDKVVKRDPKRSDKAHITIRLAKDGETIQTLDDNLVTLDSNTLVIADSTNPIAIAGIIGGKDTEIDENTQRVILECANFDRFNVRKTSMSLGIFTDAATRFTKAQNPNQCLPVILYASQLINEISKGEIASKIVDIYPEYIEQRKISLSIKKLNAHLGTKLTKEEVLTILKNIEYKDIEEDSTDEYITVLVPSFRMDINIAEDVHEDIGRIYGYENIKPVLPKRELTAGKKNKVLSIKSEIRNILSNSGANEIDTYSFVSMDLIKKSEQDPNLAYSIKNALSPELSLMRTSLITSMLSKAQENIQRNIPTFCMYEFNLAHQKGNMDNFELPKEQWNMSLLFTTKEDILEGNPYYQVKRYMEKIFSTLNILNIEYLLVNTTSQENLPVWIKNILPTFNPKSTAYITHKGEIIGVIGEFSKTVKENFKLPNFTAGVEIDIEYLSKVERENKVVYESSKYPSINQDVTLQLPRRVEYKQIERIILDTINTRDRYATVECLDIYSKEDENRNITVRIEIEHLEKTLSTKEFNKIVKKILVKTSKLE